MSRAEVAASFVTASWHVGRCIHGVGSASPRMQSMPMRFMGNDVDFSVRDGSRMQGHGLALSRQQMTASASVSTIYLHACACIYVHMSLDCLMSDNSYSLVENRRSSVQNECCRVQKLSSRDDPAGLAEDL